MMSKIIQKEKDRQDRYFVAVGCGGDWVAEMRTHKQSLINLKEYLEGNKIWIRNQSFQTQEGMSDFMDKNEEDIKELNKMIEKYEEV